MTTKKTQVIFFPPTHRILFFTHTIFQKTRISTGGSVPSVVRLSFYTLHTPPWSKKSSFCMYHGVFEMFFFAYKKVSLQ